MRHSIRSLPRSNLIAIDEEGSESSGRVSNFSTLWHPNLKVIRSLTRFSSQEGTRQKRI